MDGVGPPGPRLQHRQLEQWLTSMLNLYAWKGLLPGLHLRNVRLDGAAEAVGEDGERQSGVEQGQVGVRHP